MGRDKPVVACDLDGVLCDFLPGLVGYLNRHLDGTVAVADVTDLRALHDRYREQADGKAFHGLLRQFWSDPAIALNLPLLLPMLSALRAIRGMAARLDVLTSRLGGEDDEINMLATAWIDGYGVPCDRIVHIRDKVGYCRSEKIRLLIEDAPHIARDAAGYGIRVYLPDAPYNRDLDHGGVCRFLHPADLPLIVQQDLQ